jgi:hypothetical protein
LPIRDEQIELAVIVVIEEAASEAQHALRRGCKPGAIANFFKKTLSIVVPDMIARTLKI